MNQIINDYLRAVDASRSRIWAERNKLEEYKEKWIEKSKHIDDQVTDHEDPGLIGEFGLELDSTSNVLAFSDNTVWIDRELMEEIKELHLPSFSSSSFHFGIWLQGTRQAGKTALLDKFGKECYRKHYYLNLRNGTLRKKFESKLDEVYSMLYANASPDYDKRYALAIMRVMFTNFIDSPLSLLVIDEVQESKATYENIRELIRGLYAKVAFTGSYLGDLLYIENRIDSASEMSTHELKPVSYEEFLKASPIWNELNLLDNFLLSKKDNGKIDYANEDNRKLLKLLNKLLVFFGAYTTLGGYPKALSAFLDCESEKKCLEHRDRAVIEFILEMAKRTGNPSENLDKKALFDADFNMAQEYTPWETVMMTIVDSIVKGFSNWSMKERVDEILKEKQDKGYSTQNKSGFDYSTIVGWMNASQIITSAGVCRDLDFESTYTKYVFTNLGMLQFWESKILPIVAKNPSIIDGTTKDIVGKYRGFINENFVSNYLREIVKKYKLGAVYSYDANNRVNPEEIDFIIGAPGQVNIAVEVKSSHGTTKSSDKLIESGKIDYLIKLDSRYPNWEQGSNIITMPIYMITKLSTILRRMNDGTFEELGPCGEYVEPERIYKDEFEEASEFLQSMMSKMDNNGEYDDDDAND
jgi:hypothetical protein